MAIAARIIVENCIVGSDAREILHGFSIGEFGAVGSQKHILARLYFTISGRAFHSLGWDMPTSALISASLLAGAFAMAAFVLFRTLGLRSRLALAATCFIIGANAVAIHFAIIETYLLTATTSLVGLIVFICIDRCRTLANWQRTAVAAVVCAVVGLAHLPAISLFVVHLALEHGSLRAMLRVRALALAFMAVAGIVTIGFAPSLLVNEKGMGWASGYIDSYASFGHFFDLKLIGTHILNLFVFAFVAPFDHCSCRYIGSDAVALAREPLRIVALGSLFMVFAMAVIGLMRGTAYPRLIFGCALWLTANAVFYLYFDPYEAALPAILFVLPIAIIVTIGISGDRYGWLMLSISGALLFMSNEPLRWLPVSHLLTCCPPERQPPWLVTSKK